MSVAEVIKIIKKLPSKERGLVARFLIEEDDSWIPKSFRKSMEEAERGDLMDLDIALKALES